jgi:hypothetical protein
MSSRIEEDGTVVVTTPYSWASPGHRLYLAGGWAGFSARERRLEAAWDDYLARLTLSRQPLRVDAVRVQPPEGALLELVENGVVHPSLVDVEEPRAA